MGRPCPPTAPGHPGGVIWMPTAPDPRTSRLWQVTSSFAASPLGSPTKPVERAAGAHTESSSPKRPPFQAAPPGPLAAPPPRPRRVPPEAGRRAVRASERRPRRPAPAPAPRAGPRHPVFLQLAANAAASRDPAGRQQTLCPPAQKRFSQSLCGPEPLPYLRWGRARPRRSGAGPAGSSAQPGMRGEFATVAAARAPRRPRGASASRSGGGVSEPRAGAGAGAGPRLPAVAPGRYRRPARALRRRSARALRREAGDN